MYIYRLCVFVLAVPITLAGPAIATGPSGQRMCAECDVLREKHGIVQAKARAFDEGLRLLQEARREL